MIFNAFQNIFLFATTDETLIFDLACYILVEPETIFTLQLKRGRSLTFNTAFVLNTNADCGSKGI